MEIPPDMLMLLALFAGAIAHWFIEAWRDQSITEPELKGLPNLLVIVCCVAFVALDTFENPAAAFLGGYFVDSIFKNLFRVANGESLTKT